ncbi:MAG: ABC transporter permease subunit [Planctomycetes bacterium]|nr:ABC transporter permease subunit [Planctomycetota bacterium]
MNRGLLLKSARELWPATVLFGLAIGLVEAVLAYVLPTFQEQLAAQWGQLRFLQGLIRAMLGTEAAGALGPDMLLSIAWVHPVVLALAWGHAIVVATRVPAGEVDRGTVDLLLGLPVSRWELYLSETAACILSGLAVLAMACLGNVAGSSAALAGPRPDPGRLTIILANLLCLYLAVAGFTWLIAAWSDRRGKAMATAFALVLASFLLNYLAQLWEPAKRVSFLSVVSYYRPLFALRDGAWPAGDMVVLAVAALASWLAAGIVFSRRDLSTV